MPAARKISPRQLEILVTFAEENVDIALGRCTRGPQGQQLTSRAWNNLSLKLNAVADGVSKTGDQWRRYWIELKAKTKAKGADNRRTAARTGGGPSQLIPLTAIEERILQIVGRIAVEGLPGVRIPLQIPETRAPIVPYESPSSSQINPVTQPSTSTSVDEPFMEVEWLDELDTPTPSNELFSDPPNPRLMPATESPPPPPPPVYLQPPSAAVIPPADSSSPSLPPAQRRRRIRRHSFNDLPAWARDQEDRRLAFEERMVDAVENLAKMVQVLERIEQVLSDISVSLHR